MATWATVLTSCQLVSETRLQIGRLRATEVVLHLGSLTAGAWHGQGRKTGWWSPILLAVYDPETGGFQALCKV